MDHETTAGGIIGKEDEAQQSLLRPARDLPGDIQERLGQDRPVLDHPDRPALLHHEESRVARRRSEAQREGETARDPLQAGGAAAGRRRLGGGHRDRERAADGIDGRTDRGLARAQSGDHPGCRHRGDGGVRAGPLHGAVLERVAVGVAGDRLELDAIADRDGGGGSLHRHLRDGGRVVALEISTVVAAGPEEACERDEGGAQSGHGRSVLSSRARHCDADTERLSIYCCGAILSTLPLTVMM